MKRILLILAGAVLACLVVVLITLRVVGLDPTERRPGLWLRGELRLKIHVFRVQSG